MRVALAALCALALCGAAYGKPVRWVTDKTFARSVYAAVKDKYPAMEITCRRPLLPKRTGARLGVPQEDCLVIAASKTRFFCGEFAYMDGPLPPMEIPCTVVASTFAKMRHGQVLSLYPLVQAAPEA